MKKEIAPGVWLFVDDDEGFIRHCRDNSAGFVLNCGRTVAGEISSVLMFHRAVRDGDLCPHFKDKRTETGYAANLTTTGYCKLCSTNRQKLDEVARSFGGSVSECADCM